MELLPDLPTLIPSMGLFGVFLYLVIHLMRQQSGDRGDYQTMLLNLREQHAKDITRMVDRHDREIIECRNEIAHLREEIDQMREQLAEARKARWQAEDVAAYWRRVAGVADESPDPTA